MRADLPGECVASTLSADGTFGMELRCRPELPVRPAAQFSEAHPVTVVAAGQKRHIWINPMATPLGAMFVGLFMDYLAFEARPIMAQRRVFPQ